MKILNMALLLECFAGDRQFIAELLESYHNDTKTHLVKLGEAIKKNDAQKIASTSHSLKGISANMRLEPLRDVFSKIEKMGKEGSLNGSDKLMEEAQSLFTQFEKELREQSSRSKR